MHEPCETERCPCSGRLITIYIKVHSAALIFLAEGYSAHFLPRISSFNPGRESAVLNVEMADEREEPAGSVWVVVPAILR